MKRKLRRMASFCMTVVLLLSSVVWAPAAGAEGEKLSIEDAKISVLEYCEYDGDREEPMVEVTLQGNKLKENVDYNLSYSDNVNAGTAKVCVVGKGSYHGMQEAYFTIYPRPVTFDDLKIKPGYQKEFDGTTVAKPEIVPEGNRILAQDQNNVEIICTKGEFEDPFAGSGKTIIVSEVSFQGSQAGNYEFKRTEKNLVDEWTRITGKLPKLETSAEIAVGHTLDLKKLITNGWDGNIDFSLSGELTENLGCFIEDGVLKTGEEIGEIQIIATLSERNVDNKGDVEYSLERITDFNNRSMQANITVQVVEKEEQPPVDIGDGDQTPVDETGNITQPDLLLWGEKITYYGKTIKLNASGGAGNGAISYEWKPYNSGQVSIGSDGLLTPEKVGKILVRAIKAGDDRYKKAESEPHVITILPAPLTIQVKDKTARIGDAIPTLTAADYTVTGLVGSDTLAQAPSLTYVSTPDMSKTGAVAIQASGAAIPNGNYDPNITYLPGVLTIQEIPTYTVTVPTAENGTITADKATAQEGDTVTLTARPAEGYVLQSLTATCAAAAPGTVPLQEKGEGIYTFAMPAGDVTVTGTFALEEEEEEPWPPFPFTDVPETMWYYDSVYYVYAHGLMNGTAATLFSPGNPTTRGMLVTILYRMEGSPQGAGWGPFTDVTPGAYYAQPIAWAAWNGIVNGITSTTFAPDRNVTREQMAAILYRYTAWKGWDVSQQGNLFQFTDWQKVQTYARTPLAWAVASGLIQGKENQRLDPGGPATRAEVATILQRFHSTYVAPPAEEETA